MTFWRRKVLFLALAIGVAALVHLRDPVWLIKVHSGFGRWEQTKSGERYRWTTGHASFFVPSSAARVRLPLRAPFLKEEPGSVVVRIDVNDRPASVITLSDAQWTEANVRIPSTSAFGRRVVRLDLRVSRTWSARSVGVQVGDATVE